MKVKYIKDYFVNIQGMPTRFPEIDTRRVFLIFSMVIQFTMYGIVSFII